MDTKHYDIGHDISCIRKFRNILNQTKFVGLSFDYHKPVSCSYGSDA